MAENDQNGEWDRVLAKRLQKKRRTEVHRSGSAPPRPQPSGEPVDPADGEGETFKETLLWSSSGASPEGATAGRSAGGPVRALDARDEKKAIDILLRRRGAGAGGKVLAVGAVAAVAAAAGVLVGTKGPRVRRKLQVAADLAPPQEQEGPAARGGPGTERTGGPRQPPERLRTFHARPFRPGERPTEWKQLGGPLVDLDASPPLR
ncbi:MAG: hypothetical protein ACYSU0_08920 [Planctomycetota bacterium]|jgi:hypothetical protein